MCTPTRRSMPSTTTVSLSKTEVVPPSRGDGKFIRPAKANQCGNLNFSKRCPKRPERARRHWQNSRPSESTLNTCNAEVSVQLLAALVSSAGTNSNLKVDAGLHCGCRRTCRLARARLWHVAY